MANKKNKKRNPNHRDPNANRPPNAKKAAKKAAAQAAGVEADTAVATPSSSSKGYTPPKGRATTSKKVQAEAAAPRRRQLSPAVIIGMLVVGVLGVVFLITWLTAEDQSGVVDRAAWDLPALENDPNDDGRITLAELEGKPIVVNFFASWCTSCDRELPVFASAEDAYSDQVTFVYVNSNETGNWKPMADRNGIRDGIIARDIKSRNGSGLHRNLGGTGSLPMTAFYDANGNFVDVDLGELNSSTLDARLLQLGVDLSVIDGAEAQ